MRQFFLFSSILFFSCKNDQLLNDRPLIIVAQYIQYACGDWNDDMKVISVNDSSFNFLINKDIDPLFKDGEKELSEWFYANKTEEFYMTYRLRGFISKSALSGCDNHAPKFWITEIERLDGEPFAMSESVN